MSKKECEMPLAKAYGSIAEGKVVSLMSDGKWVMELSIILQLRRELLHLIHLIASFFIFGWQLACEIDPDECYGVHIG